MLLSTDVVAYLYKDNIHCPRCIIEIMPTGEDEEFEGWADKTQTLTAEQFLSSLAPFFGFNWSDPRDYDDDDFPKPAYRFQFDINDPYSCDDCGVFVNF